MPLIKIGLKCTLDTDKIQEWSISSVSFDTVSKLLPNPVVRIPSRDSFYFSGPVTDHQMGFHSLGNASTLMGPSAQA